MRDLLFLSHRIPYPPDKGDKIRAWHIFRHLAQTHRIHLGCFIDDPADRHHVPDLRAHCADFVCFDLDRRAQRLKALLRARPGQPLSAGYFRHRRLQNWVDAKLAAGAIDSVFVFSSTMAGYVMHATGVRRVLDMVDIDSEKWAAYAAAAGFPARHVWAREGRTLFAFERLAATRFDRSLFVSEHEWRHFVTLAPETAPRTGWITNGVDCDFFTPDNNLAAPFAGNGTDLVFTGRMDYPPNIEAVTWFAREVLPMLRRRFPACRFWIVGAAPGADVRGLATLPGVQVTGRVADTRPYLAAADVVVAPLRIARGIQNKVLEAMAMARPVVASAEAFCGIKAQPGRDILLASGVTETAQAISDILEGGHRELGAAARRAVATSHRWSVTLRPLDELFAVSPRQPAHAEGP